MAGRFKEEVWIGMDCVAGSIDIPCAHEFDEERLDLGAISTTEGNLGIEVVCHVAPPNHLHTFEPKYASPVARVPLRLWFGCAVRFMISRYRVGNRHFFRLISIQVARCG